MNFYKKIKQAIRGNIPRMEDPEPERDPYLPRSREKGEGWNLVMPGNEETKNDGSGIGGGLGTRTRKGFPTDFSGSGEDEYSQQIKEDIPTSTHTLMQDNEAPRDVPDNLTTFEDYRDSPFIADKLNRNKGLGPLESRLKQDRSSVLYENVRRRIK